MTDKMIIGITGGIGSGKSVVCKILETMNIPVYDTDKKAKELMNSSKELQKKIADIAGEGCVKEGAIDRKELAKFVFSSKANAQKIEKIVHPAVREHLETWIQEREGIMAVESAILFESGFDKLVNKTIIVYAPEEIRIERVEKRDKTNREQVKERIKAQMNDEEKRLLCTDIIVNDGEKPIIPQVLSIISSYQK